MPRRDCDPRRGIGRRAVHSVKAEVMPQMLHNDHCPSPTGGASRVRLVRKRAHCSAQASLTEVVVAVAILTIVVWGMVGFLTGGRVLVERSGQGIIATQVAQEHIDRTRSLAYASIASSNGTETVGGHPVHLGADGDHRAGGPGRRQQHVQADRSDRHLADGAACHRRDQHGHRSSDRRGSMRRFHATSRGVGLIELVVSMAAASIALLIGMTIWDRRVDANSKTFSTPAWPTRTLSG